MKITEKDGKLVIADFNEEEAYEIACNIEKEGVRFYKKLKGKQSDDKIKEMLEFMIKEEEKHLKFFEAIRNDLQAQRDEEIEDNELIMSMDFGIFQPYESIEHLEAAIIDSKKALKLGIIVEDKAIAFYSQCQKKISSKSAKKGIGNIVEEEKRHKNLFEEMLKKLK